MRAEVKKIFLGDGEVKLILEVDLLNEEFEMVEPLIKDKLIKINFEVD